MPVIIKNSAKSPQIQYLYNEGNEYVDFTGGWVQGIAKGTAIVQRVSEKLSNNIHQWMKGSGSTSQYISYPIRTNNLINITDYSKLKVKSYNVRGNQAWEMAVISLNTDLYTGDAYFFNTASNPNFVFLPQNANGTTISITEYDISSLNGSYYIYLTTFAGQSEDREMNIMSVYLEV